MNLERLRFYKNSINSNLHFKTIDINFRFKMETGVLCKIKSVKAKFQNNIDIAFLRINNFLVYLLWGFGLFLLYFLLHICIHISKMHC
jgi:hypothetical protein